MGELGREREPLGLDAADADLPARGEVGAGVVEERADAAAVEAAATICGCGATSWEFDLNV